MSTRRSRLTSAAPWLGPARHLRARLKEPRPGSLRRRTPPLPRRSEATRWRLNRPTGRSSHGRRRRRSPDRIPSGCWPARIKNATAVLSTGQRGDARLTALHMVPPVPLPVRDIQRSSRTGILPRLDCNRVRRRVTRSVRCAGTGTPARGATGGLTPVSRPSSRRRDLYSVLRRSGGAARVQTITSRNQQRHGRVRRSRLARGILEPGRAAIVVYRSSLQPTTASTR